MVSLWEAMIIWAGLFLIIITISLILALRSMRDYTAAPIHLDMHYSLYLIKNEAGLNEEILKNIDAIINQKRLIIAFERLYKGSKQALVIYGPEVILKQFIQSLDLIELEDYSLKYTDPLPSGILSWEISSKDYHAKPEQFIIDLSKDPPALLDHEQLWWQVVIQPKCEKNGLQSLFKTVIRVAVIAENDNRAGDIKSNIDEAVKQTNLLTVPQVFSTAQMIKSYQKRSLPQTILDKEGGHFVVSVEDIKDLVS